MMKKGDYLGELSDYIKKNLRKGYTKESLKWALVSQGHSKLEVEKALKKVEADLSKEAPVLKTKPEITYDVVEPKNAILEEKKSFWKRIFGL
ncbi:MAG: hypothetical protein AABX85_03860 [Nanoarchaeota archaeon]